MNFLTALTIGLQYSVNDRTMLCAVPVLIKNHITAAGTYVNRGNDSNNLDYGIADTLLQSQVT